jgi:hypothetical protein
MNMRLELKLPPLLLVMMICLYPNGCEGLIVMFWDTMIMKHMQQ